MRNISLFLLIAACDDTNRADQYAHFLEPNAECRVVRHSDPYDAVWCNIPGGPKSEFWFCTSNPNSCYVIGPRVRMVRAQAENPKGP